MDPCPHQNQIPTITFSPSARTWISAWDFGHRKGDCINTMRSLRNLPSAKRLPFLSKLKHSQLHGGHCPTASAAGEFWSVTGRALCIGLFPWGHAQLSLQNTPVCRRKKEIEKKVSETPKLSSTYLVRPKRIQIGPYKGSEHRRSKSKQYYQIELCPQASLGGRGGTEWVDPISEGLTLTDLDEPKPPESKAFEWVPCFIVSRPIPSLILREKR